MFNQKVSFNLWQLCLLCSLLLIMQVKYLLVEFVNFCHNSKCLSTYIFLSFLLSFFHSFSLFLSLSLSYSLISKFKYRNTGGGQGSKIQNQFLTNHSFPSAQFEKHICIFEGQLQLSPALKPACH